LNSDGRKLFLELLAGEYDVDNKAVEDKIEQQCGKNVKMLLQVIS
jgi:hypothetical protein